MTALIFKCSLKISVLCQQVISHRISSDNPFNSLLVANPDRQLANILTLTLCYIESICKSIKECQLLVVSRRWDLYPYQTLETLYESGKAFHNVSIGCQLEVSLWLWKHQPCRQQTDLSIFIKTSAASVHQSDSCISAKLSYLTESWTKTLLGICWKQCGSSPGWSCPWMSYKN